MTRGHGAALLGAALFAVSAVLVEFVQGPAQAAGIIGLYVFVVGGVFVIASRDFVARDRSAEPQPDAGDGPEAQPSDDG